MTVCVFRSDYAVQIRSPKFGSGYRLGGRLVLTAAHLFEEMGNSKDCRVRLHEMRGEIDACVVWISSSFDVALVELPESESICDPVRLGQLPQCITGEVVQFKSYSWPEWGFSNLSGGPSAGGRQVDGKIYLADTSPEGLMVLEPDRCPEINPDATTSPWQGASGSAIVCMGYLVAVQSQHQNPKRPASLEAVPIERLCQDSNWCSWLDKYGIEVEPHIVPLASSDNTAIQVAPSRSRADVIPVEQQMARSLWSLNYDDQQEIFEDWLDSDRVAGAFAIEVNYDLEADLQKCLVSRLSRFLVGGQVPVFGTLGVSREWRNQPLSQFILALAPSLDLPAAAGISEVHDRLLDLCLTRSTIIALYDTPDMGKEALKELLEKFWHPMVNRLQQASGNIYQGRILLFLAGSRPMSLLKDNAGEPFALDYPDCLENITTLDIGNWRRIPEVRQFMNRRSAVIPDLRQALQQIGTRESEQSQILEANAYDAIEKIVGVFGFEGGLEGLERYWQLSGDLAA